MNLQRLGLLLLILIITSCSSKKFAFRKTYDATAVSNVTVRKHHLVKTDTLSENNTPDIAELNAITNTLSSPAVKQQPHQSQKATAVFPSHHDGKIIIASDPVPPGPTPPEENRGGNAGLVALALILIAALLYWLAYITSSALFAFAGLFLLAAFIMSIIALKRKSYKAAAIIALILSILLFFTILGVEMFRANTMTHP